MSVSIQKSSARRKRASRLKLILSALIGGFIGVVCLLYVGSEIREYVQLQWASEAVEAKITDMQVYSVGSGSRRHADHMITYEYLAGDVVLSDEYEVTSDYYNQAVIGGTITIRYLTGEPTESMIIGQGLDTAVNWLVIGIALLVGLPSMLIPLVQLFNARH